MAGVGLVLLTLLLIPIFAGQSGLILLVAIVAGVLILAIVYQPHWGVLIILTGWLTGLAPAIPGMRALKVAQVMGVILLIPLGLHILRERSIWVWGVPQIRLLAGIGLLFAVSTWWNESLYAVTVLEGTDQTRAMLQEFVTHLAFLVFFVYFVTTRRRIEFSVWWVVGLIVAAALSAILTGQGGRVHAAFGLGENANRLAFICVFGTSLVWFARSLAGGRRWKLLTSPLLFLLPGVALATGSRSGFLQLVVFAALVFKEQHGWSPGKRVRSLLLLVAMVVVIAMTVPAARFLRATSYSTATEAKGGVSLQQRIESVKLAARIFAGNPLLGVGIGNFRWVKEAFYDLPGAANPHNSYLWALTAGGIGVLILYLVLFKVTYGMLRRLERYGPRELLWLSKALRINLILFLLFSAFADFWLSDFLYLIVGWTIVLTSLWAQQEWSGARRPTLTNASLSLAPRAARTGS